MKNLDFSTVTITGGFWQYRQKLNRQVTIPAVYHQFDQTGRIEAFRFNWKPGMPKKPHFFWDSDVAKWMESAAYILHKSPDSSLENQIEALIDQIEAHQEPDGYFNIYYTVCEPEKRFTDRRGHELYCAGHLIEAAVAYYHATGKDRFLKIMCRYADLIDRVFRIEQSAAFATPGHPEIELALVRLYHATQNERYLKLSQFFIDARCNDKDGFDNETIRNDPKMATYSQDHLPLRAQTTAEGHAVRACYLYTAMADIAKETGDTALLNACKKIFENIIRKRMYITGGIGSAAAQERFTYDYDLPNLLAYSETCAAIALVFFAHRMAAIEENAVYADIIERILFNGFLSATSLSGDSFFYENPLEIDPQLSHRDHPKIKRAVEYPQTTRAKVFTCSCCPPNITRFVATLGDYIYSANGDTVYINQFIESEATFDNISIKQTTAFPNKGDVKISVSGSKVVAIRIPSWCTSFTLNQHYVQRNGFAVIENPDGDILLSMNMTPFLVMANPKVRENVGRVALQRGPVVYCLEGIDNGEDLRTLYIDKQCNTETEDSDMFRMPIIYAKGWRRVSSGALYAPLSENFVETTLKFIPYYGFANRGETEMLVYVNYR